MARRKQRITLIAKPTVAEVLMDRLARMQRAEHRRGAEVTAVLHAVAEHLAVLANPVAMGEALPTLERAKGEAQFVSVITQRRGGFEALIALDAVGGLWEYHREIDQSTKEVLGEYWTPMVITRREK